MGEPIPEADRVLYLDYNATTPVAPAVLAEMLPYFTDAFANPASSHDLGALAASAVEAARGQVAELIGAAPREIIFTSGATEATNLALAGILAAGPPGQRHLIVGSTEHKAVLDTAAALAHSGIRVTHVPVDEYGLIDLDFLEGVLRRRPGLVSIMAANNETGTLASLEEIGALVRGCGGLFHSDATQWLGKLPCDVDLYGIDLMSASAHKMYGPKGVGALYVRSHLEGALSPLVHGGGHERGLRSGTLNVPGIVGFGAACALAAELMPGEVTRLAGLRDDLDGLLRASVPGLALNGHPSQRLPNTLNVQLGPVDAEVVMAAAPDLALAAGSACTSASPEPSHVLLAMGRDTGQAASSVRISLGRATTPDDVTRAGCRLSAAVRYAHDVLEYGSERVGASVASAEASP